MFCRQHLVSSRLLLFRISIHSCIDVSGTPTSSISERLGLTKTAFCVSVFALVRLLDIAVDDRKIPTQLSPPMLRIGLSDSHLRRYICDMMLMHYLLLFFRLLAPQSSYLKEVFLGWLGILVNSIPASWIFSCCIRRVWIRPFMCFIHAAQLAIVHELIGGSVIASHSSNISRERREISSNKHSSSGCDHLVNHSCKIWVQPI